MSPRDLVQASDADLVALVLAGSDGAFDVLFRRHAARVAGVCRRRVPAHEVDDIVQDVFLRAHSHLDQLRDPAAVGAWLRSIAVRCCAERHRGSHPAEVDVDDDVVVLYDDAMPVDERIVRQERAAEVHRNLRSLSDRDREALWLRDALEVPISELAARFGTTEGSTRVLLTRARRRMKASYVAAIAWLTALGKGKWDRAAEFAPVAAGVVAANIMAFAVVGGVTDNPTMQAPPSVEAAPSIELVTTAPSSESASFPDSLDESLTTRTSTPATAAMSDGQQSQAQADEIGLRTEDAPADAKTYEVTVDDGEDQPLLGLWLDGESSNESPSEDPEDESSQDDEDEDEDGVLACVASVLASESCD